MAAKILMASTTKRLKMSDRNASCSTSNKTPYFNFDSSDLGDLVNMKAFVDKTRLIKEIFKTTPMILITAPHGFGKSTNLDMVKRFFEIQVDVKGNTIEKTKSSNHQIFKDNNLLIFQDKGFFDDHFATYPVIFTSFKDVRAESYEGVLEGFRDVLNKTYSKHEYLLESKIWKKESLAIDIFKKYLSKEESKTLSEGEIKRGLWYLSRYLFYHYDEKKVFVLIDEYDAPINNTMFEKEVDIKRIDNLLACIFSFTLKGNKYVTRALLSGISYFASVAFSAANNIEKYMFLTNHRFVPYYGATETEVDKLLNDFKIDTETKEKVKLHYNGYLSLSGTKLFSMWSILHFLQKQKIENYWEDSGLITNLKEAMNDPHIRCCIETLCLGKSVNIHFSKIIELHEIIELKIDGYIRTDRYLSFLLQQGYLTIIDHQVEYRMYVVRVPNAEIFSQFRTKLLKHYGESINSYIQTCAVSFEKISSSSENEIFIDFITKFNELLDKFKNKFVECNEDTYHCIMFYILCKTKFSFSTEITAPGARVELMICEGNLGIIIELKHKKSSKEALKEIRSKYLNPFDENPFLKNVTSRIYIGLHVSKNNVADMSVLVNTTDLSKARSF